MPEIIDTVQGIATADTWDVRVTLFRRVPESFGLAHLAEVYAAIAKEVYVPFLAPDFAYVSWRQEYELSTVEEAYHQAHAQTGGFSHVGVDDIARAIGAEPASLRIFRLLLGLLPQEFAAASRIVAQDTGLPDLSSGRIKTIEAGGACSPGLARCCAEVVTRAMALQLFPPASLGLTAKIEKPDTVSGWQTVRDYAAKGVPFPVFLHQRHYGGAFRQLLDATSTMRGDRLEVAVEELFTQRGVQFIRTGSGNQGEIEARFGVTVRTAPDFVVFDAGEPPRAMLECKAINDGGTARDKASRYSVLRQESMRLGGMPLFAVLGGLGWTRTKDALGPVLRDTDGRVFTLGNLAEMLTVSPFPLLVTPQASTPE